MRSRSSSRQNQRAIGNSDKSNVVRTIKLPVIGLGNVGPGNPNISDEISSGGAMNTSSYDGQGGYSVGVCSQQGKRPYQEDQYAIRQFLNLQTPSGRNTPDTHFFGLFDGHAGGRCSQHLASSLASTLAFEDSFSNNIPMALKKSFHVANENFLKIAEKNKWHDGSTGNVAVIRDRKITVANVGDCRAIVISNNRPIVQLSIDHKPTNPEEQKRIASLGGAVVFCQGVARVNRVLAVSRAFGNRTLRSVIRPDADIHQKDILPGDDFLVMASDGLWDVLKNKDVATVCYLPFLSRKPQAIADELVHTALMRGTMDNVTCIVVSLSEYERYESFNMTSFHMNSAGGLNNLINADSPNDFPSGLDSQSVANLHFLASLSDKSYKDALSSQLQSGVDEEDDSDEGFNSFMKKKKITAAPSTATNANTSAGRLAKAASNNSMIPSFNRQRSLGTLNSKETTLADASDSSNAISKPSFVKSGSMNSLSAMFHNLGDSSSLSASLPTSSGIAMAQQSDAANYLRPLTAIEFPGAVGNISSTPRKQQMSSNTRANTASSGDAAIAAARQKLSMPVQVKAGQQSMSGASSLMLLRGNSIHSRDGTAGTTNRSNVPNDDFAGSMTPNERNGAMAEK